MKLTTIASLSMLVLATTSTAHAADLVDEGRRWIAAALAGPTAATFRPSSSIEESALAGTAPVDGDFMHHASFVVRDWHGSMRLASTRGVLMDDLRPSSSNRMVMARFDEAHSRRVSSYLQVGAGQWRIDPVLFPTFTSEVLAGQVGLGVELHLARGVQLAGECNYTLLYHDPTGEAGGPGVAGVLVAAQIPF